PISGAQVTINSNGQLGIVMSSARYKRDIHEMGQSSQGLYSLRPVTFRYKQDPQGQRQYGLIAEEVAKVYPELVTKGADGKVESVQYHELIPMLLNEVQHQQQEIAALKVQAQQVGELKVQNGALAARLERLEQGATQRRALGVCTRRPFPQQSTDFQPELPSIDTERGALQSAIAHAVPPVEELPGTHSQRLAQSRCRAARLRHLPELTNEVRPAQLAVFNEYPAIAGPAIGDHNARNRLAHQFLGHLAAPAEQNEKARARVGHGRP